MKAVRVSSVEMYPEGRLDLARDFSAASELVEKITVVHLQFGLGGGSGGLLVPVSTTVGKLGFTIW